MTDLNSLPLNRWARVLRINCRGAVRRRLAEMGLSPGVLVCVERVAPLGDPLKLKLRGYRLSLRRAEARNIAVHPVTDEAAALRRR
jgi:ferrous iron transport protein A